MKKTVSTELVTRIIYRSKDGVYSTCLGGPTVKDNTPLIIDWYEASIYIENARIGGNLISDSFDVITGIGRWAYKSFI